MGQNPNKKRIILVITVIAFIILSVAAFFIINGLLNRPKEETKVPVENAKASFNEFFHYMTDKSEDDGDITYEQLVFSEPYLRKNANASDKKEYLEMLEAKFNSFASIYKASTGKSEIKNIYAYYYGYYKVNYELSRLNIVRYYYEEGPIEARNYTLEIIAPQSNPEKTNSYLDAYIEDNRQFLTAQINSIPLFESSGCIVNQSTIKQDCVLLNGSERDKYYSELIKYSEMSNKHANSLGSSSLSSLQNVYSEIYGYKKQNEGVVTK